MSRGGKILQVARRWPAAAVIMAAVAVLAATRWPLRTEYLAHFDAINFAFSLERFDPLLHQPQPPGYPLAAWLLKPFVGLGASAEAALYWQGVAAGAVSTVFLWSLAKGMVGGRAALLACLLLWCHPFCWLAGIRNPVRLWLAAGSSAVAYFAWKVLRRGERPLPWLAGAAAALAVGAALRPELLLFLGPLTLVAAIQSRPRVKEVVLAAAIVIPATVAWLWPLLESFGGYRAFLFVVWHYAREQFAGSSALLGAPGSEALAMAIKAVLWTGAGVVCWLWALQSALLRKGAPLPPGSGLLLGLWVLPAFAFHAVVHVGDPEHTLVSAPALSLLGGWVLSRWADGSGRRLVLAGALAGGLSCALYLLPWPFSEHNHWKARRAAQQVAGVVEPIKARAAKQPVFVISWESAGLWRQVSYYVPESPVLILHGAPDNPGLEARHMFYCRRQRGSLPMQGRRIWVPAGMSVAIIPPVGWELNLAKELGLTYRQEDPVLFVDLSGESFRLGAFELVRTQQAEAPCRSNSPRPG